MHNRVTVAATTVGLLMAIVATLGVTICWVRVRRVALLYEVRLGTPPFKPATLPTPPPPKAAGRLTPRFSCCVRCHRGS